MGYNDMGINNLKKVVEVMESGFLGRKANKEEVEREIVRLAIVGMREEFMESYIYDCVEKAGLVKVVYDEVYSC